MSNIKIYQVEHEPTGGSITVEINYDHVSVWGDEKVAPHGMIKKMVDFWHGSKERLQNNDNEYLATFLKQLCELCLKIQIEYNYDTVGIVEKFAALEGYCSMDGSDGIRITDVSPADFDEQEEYIIHELPCEEF